MLETIDSIPPLAILYHHGIALYAIDLVRYLVAATLVSAVVWAMHRTRLASRKIQKREATAADRRREVLQSLRTIGVYTLIGTFIVWGEHTGVLHSFDVSYGLWGNLALFAGILVAHDAYFYWAHRAMHHPRLFRVFHLAHHRSITPTPWAAYSFAVPEAAVMILFVPLWLLFVPTPGPVMLAWGLFQIGRNAVGHAGYELHPRWWLSNPLTALTTTTTHHDLHHAGRFDSNYGLWFTWWDKWMGTEHKDYRARFEAVVGGEDPAQPKSIKPVSPIGA